MSATSAVPASKGSSLVQSIILAGLIVFVLRTIDYLVVFNLILGVPATILWQYVASGVLGVAAFEGGTGTVLLGLLFHLIIAMTVSAVFFIAAQRLSFMRRNLLISGLVYSVIVWFVMNIVVTPLSATPPPDPVPAWVPIEGILGHAVMVGLPLAFLVQRTFGKE